MIRVAINGFGRIGRCVYRILAERSNIEVVAINDVGSTKALGYLLRFDTVMGPFPGSVEFDADKRLMKVSAFGRDHEVRVCAEKDPAALPWEELGVDVAIEATGVFRVRDTVQKHAQAGARKVILTVPADREGPLDKTIVIGVNDKELTAKDILVSNASCTTNCLAPLAKILDERLGGIRKGFMTTVHAYTNDQRLAAYIHSDPRRSRAAAQNIIPTTTGAAKAVGEVLPKLKGKLDGIALRVPVPDGSVVQLVTEMNRDVTVKEVKDALRDAAQGELKGILEYRTEPLVSSDILGNPHSSIFDAACTQVTNGRILNTVAWYDNEWGYSTRVCDLIEKLAALR